MKVNKFMAPSMPEAMKLVRAELGNDAVILNSRVVESGGFLGFFRKKNFEVIAAVDPAPKQKSKPLIKEKTKPVHETLKKAGNKEEELVTHSKSDSDLIKEINGLKDMIRKELGNPDRLRPVYPEPINHIQQLMEEQEVARDLQEHFISALLERWYRNGQEGHEKKVTFWFREELDEYLRNCQFGGISFTKKFVNVVGPTGVGKTTTLAKMAADCVIKYKKKVAFITTDTYRIAAIDQLKTYAKILDVPIEVCYNMDDFQEASRKFESFDVILVDTAGRNFRNPQYVKDLQKIIDFDQEMETFLVLSLAAKQKDMEEIYKQFSAIKINSLVFTKADETSIYGSMINMMHANKVGVSYITNGQNVPDDMIAASPEPIINLLLGVERHE
ncbi:flagellar biosynthesis protein FlhF [Neobacillus terrae]|uniref:flagellar biosynthesis protein FlhF n=1 Tax=Neobacillus terrae TaxID=3034837 RepID=UPI00140C69D3|nr:flagellar biosynthesis protein FlhF [Neobacillus terrae]NHM29812.1 flagellar biosynthesis protein FlhF [Neobacillus terrae]